MQVNITEQDKYNDFPALIEAVISHLEFQKWGFEVVHSGKLFDSASALIFQSEFCKLRVWTFRDRPYEQSEIYYSYGRLHAPNEKHTIKLDKRGGREYHCWHNHLNFYLVLGFLDGLSAQKVAKRSFPYFPDVLLKFNNNTTELGHHERFARQQNIIWNHYGQRLFEFYDIRTPNLWDQYFDFIKEFRSLVKEDESLYEIDIY